LCFEYLKTFSVPENNLPRCFIQGDKNALRSRRFLRADSVTGLQ
jgi:hypothetical protein